MISLKAIETAYKGYRFRSRLEARWAIFLDALGVVWEYEKDGFDLGGEWYLPDFYFPATSLWVEIKPQMLPEFDYFCSRFGFYTAQPIALFGGPVGYGFGKDDAALLALADYRHFPQLASHDDNLESWLIGLVQRVGSWPADEIWSKLSGISVDDGMLFEATQAARGARFEHGERPQMRQAKPSNPEPEEECWPEIVR